MGRYGQTSTPSHSGYCLLEVMVVLSLLGICLAIGATAVSPAFERQENRASAQSLQAAAAWAQVGVLRQGGEAKVELQGRRLAVTNDLGSCGGPLADRLTSCEPMANVSRWNTTEGLSVSFKGALASPDGGGSIYFPVRGGAYRVIIRPESGLTIRSWVSW